MHIIKIEIFDEDVDCPELDDLALEISEGYRFDDFPAAHVRVTNEQTGEFYEVNPHAHVRVVTNEKTGETSKGRPHND